MAYQACSARAPPRAGEPTAPRRMGVRALICLVALTTMGGGAEAAKDPATLLLHGPGHNCTITMTATSYADREVSRPAKHDNWIPTDSLVRSPSRPSVEVRLPRVTWDDLYSPPQ